MTSFRDIEINDLPAVKQFFEAKGVRVEGTFTAVINEPAKTFEAGFIDVVVGEKSTLVFAMENEGDLQDPINYLLLQVPVVPEADPQARDFEIKPQDQGGAWAYLGFETRFGYASQGKIESACVGPTHFTARHFQFEGEGDAGHFEVERGAFDVHVI